MLTLKQIETLYWIARSGSFTAAARRLNAAQSTISKRIAEIERRIGQPVFDRSGNRVRLTNEGMQIFTIGEQFIELGNKLRGVSRAAEPLRGHFKFGITEAMAVLFLPRLTTAVRAQHPRLVLEPEVASSGDLFERLERKTLDLVIGSHVTVRTQMSYLHLGHVEFSWMCSPRLLSRKGPVAIEEIARLPILADTTSSAFQKVFLRPLRQNGISSNRMMSCNSMFALAALASDGLGVTILPRAMFRDYITSRRLRVLDAIPPLPKMEFVAAHRSDDVVSVAAEIAKLSASLGIPGERRHADRQAPVGSET
jgi:DNA-binding transcriptional LysR family regulator